MPIRKEQKALYPPPPEWQAIRARILKRAKYRCEQCGVSQYSIVSWHGHERVIDQDPFSSYREARAYVEGLREAGSVIRRTVIVLTTAHLHHTLDNHRDDVLAALCQACHLRHDATLHVTNRRITIKAKKQALWEKYGRDEELLF